jgi:hypothetical protein
VYENKEKHDKMFVQKHALFTKMHELRATSHKSTGLVAENAAIVGLSRRSRIDVGWSIATREGVIAGTAMPPEARFQDPQLTHDVLENKRG